MKKKNQEFPDFYLANSLSRSFIILWFSYKRDKNLEILFKIE